MSAGRVCPGRSGTGPCRRNGSDRRAGGACESQPLGSGSDARSVPHRLAAEVTRPSQITRHLPACALPDARCRQATAGTRQGPECPQEAPASGFSTALSVCEGGESILCPFLTMDALYQLSYVGLALASYRRGVGSPRPTGAAALSRAGSSWREGVELVGACGGVQVGVVDEDGPEVLVHGERRGQVDRVHRA